MSIPYEELHKAALLHVPEGSIKPTSAWIAIALHTIETAEDLKGRNSFLWLKCYPKITMKTLKHEYFLRNPIEEFELKFVSEFVSEKWQVKNLQRANPIPASNVIVLRVFENEKVDAENELEEQEQFVRNVKEQVHSGRGLGPDSAIVLDADVYEEEKKAVAQSSLKRKRLIEADDGDDEPPTSKVNATSTDVEKDDPVEEGQVDEGQADDDRVDDGQFEESQFDNGDNAQYDNSTFDEAMDMTEQQQQQVTEDRANQYEIHGFLTRLSALPEHAQTRFNESPWTRCGSCQSPMYLQPWTLFGHDYSGLCTACSRAVLTNQEDMESLAQLNELCRNQCGDKGVRQAQGLPQNMHNDAPLDHSLPLEEYLEVAEATRNREAQGSEENGQDDGQMDQEGDNATVQDEGEEHHSPSELPADKHDSKSQVSTPSPNHSDGEIDQVVDYALSRLSAARASQAPDYQDMVQESSGRAHNSYTLFDHLVNSPDPLEQHVTNHFYGTHEHDGYDTASEASFATAGEDVLSNGDPNHVHFDAAAASNDDPEDMEAPEDEWETESESVGASDAGYAPQDEAEEEDEDDE